MRRGIFGTIDPPFLKKDFLYINREDRIKINVLERTDCLKKGILFFQSKQMFEKILFLYYNHKELGYL